MVTMLCMILAAHASTHTQYCVLAWGWVRSLTKLAHTARTVPWPRLLYPRQAVDYRVALTESGSHRFANSHQAKIEIEDLVRASPAPLMSIRLVLPYIILHVSCLDRRATSNSRRR